MNFFAKMRDRRATRRFLKEIMPALVTFRLEMQQCEAKLIDAVGKSYGEWLRKNKGMVSRSPVDIYYPYRKAFTVINNFLLKKQWDVGAFPEKNQTLIRTLMQKVRAIYAWESPKLLHVYYDTPENAFLGYETYNDDVKGAFVKSLSYIFEMWDKLPEGIQIDYSRQAYGYMQEGFKLIELIDYLEKELK